MDPFVSSSTSGNPVEMLVSIDTTPDNADVDRITTQSTSCIMTPAGIIASAVWHTVRNALIPAAFRNVLSMIAS